jgi:predicted metal-dependent phosphotriesterase family hydrolase
MRRRIRTVLGDIAPEDLGATYCHEHLLTAPAPHLAGADRDLVLDDPARARAELDSFRAAGGRAIVEVTTPEFGRSPDGLRRLAAATGVHIVATTGHVSEEYWRGVLDLDARSEQELTAEFEADLTDGMSGTQVSAGVIKVGSSLGAVTAPEAKIMRAAAAAQRATGAPITTHTTAGTAALEQVSTLEAAGADLGRVCVGHLDRRLVWPEHLEIARTGVFVGFDCISKEQYQPDSKRAQYIARLFDAGHGRQICLSGDLARRSYLGAWGGEPGYRYILESFVPLLRRAGLDDDAVHALLVANPASFLSW